MSSAAARSSSRRSPAFQVHRTCSYTAGSQILPSSVMVPTWVVDALLPRIQS